MSLNFWDLEPIVGEGVRIISSTSAPFEDTVILKLSNGEVCLLDGSAEGRAAYLTYRGERHRVELTVMEPK